jgi:TonB family protein
MAQRLLTGMTCAALACLQSTGSSAQEPSSAAVGQSRCMQSMQEPSVRGALPWITTPQLAALTCDCISRKGPPASSAAGRQGAAMVALGCVVQALKETPVEESPNAEQLLRLSRLVADDTPKGNYKNATLRFQGSCKPPEYPAASLRAAAQGTTRLLFQVAIDGKPRDVLIVRSAGNTAPHKLLDFSVALAGMQCTFTPAQLDGKDVEGWVSIEYVWELR